MKTASIAFVMRFKSLPSAIQDSITAKWADFVREDTEVGLFPIVPAATWLNGFRILNVRIGANGLPSMESMHRVVTWVDELLHGPAQEHGTCSCCGTNF
jgi:hypothetical protein